MKKKERVLGIMSGTSLDGVDYALCEVSQREGIRLVRLWRTSYPQGLKKRLMAAATDKISSYEMAQLHHDLGRFYAQKSPNIQCDYIGMHGQTVYHNPKQPRPSTFQIGEPAYLAAKYGKPVVSQFRTMDLAFGGQGAPVATLFHRQVFAHPKLTVAVNNLGGISNVTYLDKNKILSFDTGPANILIDYAINAVTKGKKNYDQDGDMAARGISRPDLILKWLEHPFFKEHPPKSTGREDFGDAYFKSILQDCRKAKLSHVDFLATVTDFTAQSLALNYERFLPKWPDVVILCGGGASNPTLIKRIRHALNERQWNQFGKKLTKTISVTTSDALGWPSQAIEAAAFALLAFHTMHDKVGNIPETTGAKRGVVLGQITPTP